jgi:hypothetical protein
VLPYLAGLWLLAAATTLNFLNRPVDEIVIDTGAESASRA